MDYNTQSDIKSHKKLIKRVFHHKIFFSSFYETEKTCNYSGETLF